MVKNSFSNFFGSPYINPLANLDGCMPECVYRPIGLCPTYATALDDAEENRNGRRLVALGVIRKTGITSLNFFGPPCRTP